MWSRLDDALIDHRKILQAGAELGRNGPAIALGFYAVCLLWTNKHLMDGFIPAAVLDAFPHVASPRTVAAALINAGLLEAVVGGVQIHDYGQYNEKAAVVKQKREADRDRKRQVLPLG